MKQSAKLALLVVFVLAAVVIGYYVVQNKKDNRTGPTGIETLTRLSGQGDEAALSQAQQPGDWTGEDEPAAEELPDLMARVNSHIGAAAPAQAAPAEADEPPTLTLAGEPLSLSATSLRNDAPVLAQADPAPAAPAAPVAADPADAPEAAGDAGLPPEALTPAALPADPSALPASAGSVPSTEPSATAPAPTASVAEPPAALPAAPLAPAPAAPAAPATYTIQSGDTFSSIARKLYGKEGKWTDIAQANPLVDPARLKIGQVIKLPDPSAPAASAGGVNAPIPEPATSVGAGMYLVQAGDTLSGISKRRYGTTARWKDIYDANRAVINGEPEDLREGMKLTLPAGE